MTTDERLAKVAAMLGEHEYDAVLRSGAYVPGCNCGWASGLEWASVDVYDAHVAAALAPLLDEFAAQDREAAWDEGFDAGERDVFEHHEHGFDTPCISNPYTPHEAHRTGHESDAQPESGSGGHRDGTGAQRGAVGDDARGSK